MQLSVQSAIARDNFLVMMEARNRYRRYVVLLRCMQADEVTTHDSSCLNVPYEIVTCNPDPNGYFVLSVRKSSPNPKINL